MEVNLNEIYQYLMLMVPQAGNMLREAFYKDKKTASKEGNYADLVTKTDVQIQNTIINCLKDKYKDHKFIGEESTEQGKVQLTNDPIWVIDPIDGTTNFVHGLPQCCISVAFFLNREVKIGVVFNPITDHVFSAIKGQGAYLNGRTIYGSGVTGLNVSQIATEFGSSRELSHLQLKTDNMLNIIGKVHSIRSIGSTALDICYVALGSCDAFFTYGIHIWDVAASVLIAREAGCVVLDPNGTEFNFLNRRILVAASTDLARQIVPLLTPILYESD
jgi:myo-inositol-1(or 4)-monophosphatase